MAKKDWHIVPECYIDTNLTEFLLDSHGVNHQKGCNVNRDRFLFTVFCVFYLLISGELSNLAVRIE